MTLRDHPYGGAIWLLAPCLDVLARIQAARVLVVGATHGYWGVLLRAAGVHVEAIAAPGVGGDGFDGAYAHLHARAPLDVLQDRARPWDAVLHELGSGLGPDGDGRDLLEASLGCGSYVLVAVRRGAPGPDEWAAVAPVRALDWDPEHGVGVVCLSRTDPARLRDDEAPPWDVGGRSRVAAAANGLATVLSALAERTYELRYARHNSLYRAAVRLRRTPLWNAARWLRNRNADVVRVRALGERGAGAGTEVWLLAARDARDEMPVPWDFVEHDGSWRPQYDDAHPYGQCLVSDGGWLRVPVGSDPELVFLRHPWSGRVEITFRGRRRVLDLHDAVGGRVCVWPAREEAERPVHGRDDGARPGRVAPADERTQDWIERTRAAAPRAIAVHCPRWLGVSNSTRNLFAHTYPIPATPELEPRHVDEAAIAAHAETLLATGVGHFVISGGDEVYLRLVDAVRAREPAVRFDLLWHGSYLHFSDAYHWFLMQRWLDLARQGVVTTIGTVKAGMERFFARLGVRAALVLNYVPGEVLDPPPAGDALDVGIWISGVNPLKSPHAMLCALAMTPGARLHAAGTGGELRALVETFGIPVGEFSDEALPAPALEAAIRRTQVTLYVTFSECCPMLPLESLRLGVPALLGPTSHLFEDHPYLRERLVVPYPDRADTIADFLRVAAAERQAIVEAYRAYAPLYNERARRSVESFLD